MTLPTSYRAYRSNADGYQNLELAQVNLREPKPLEAVVRVHAVSLQFRDLLVAKGDYGLPTGVGIIPCSDMAGTIVALGDDVQRFSVGERVCANFAPDFLAGEPTPENRAALGGERDGVLAEYVVVPAYSLVRVPEHLSFVEGATLPCAALTAWNALTGSTPIKGGDTVLVLGTGGVSIFALQFAAASGATVILTSSSDTKLALGRELGAHYTINYKTTPEWDEEVKKITKGRGVDHVVEVGGLGTIERSVNAVRLAGSVHLIGTVSKGASGIPLIPAILRSIKLNGVVVGSVRQFEDMNRFIEARGLRPVVDRTFPFEQAREAYKYQDSQGFVGKVVIEVVKE